MQQQSEFRMEAAGSLTPELNGGPRSGAHRHRTKEKGRDTQHEARQKKTAVLPLEEEEER